MLDKKQKEALREHYRLAYQLFNSFTTVSNLDCIDDTITEEADMPVSYDFETTRKMLSDYINELEEYCDKTNTFSSRSEL